MSLASFDSPEKRIPLVNLVDQFSLLSACFRHQQFCMIQ